MSILISRRGISAAEQPATSCASVNKDASPCASNSSTTIKRRKRGASTKHFLHLWLGLTLVISVLTGLATFSSGTQSRNAPTLLRSLKTTRQEPNVSPVPMQTAELHANNGNQQHDVKQQAPAIQPNSQSQRSQLPQQPQRPKEQLRRKLSARDQTTVMLKRMEAKAQRKDFDHLLREQEGLVDAEEEDFPVLHELQQQIAKSSPSARTKHARVREEQDRLDVFYNDYLEKIKLGDIFDYNQPTTKNAETLPPPQVRSGSRLVALVISARSNFEARQAIRETWGKGHTLYFVVGGKSEPYHWTYKEQYNETVSPLDADPQNADTFWLDNGTVLQKRKRYVTKFVQEPDHVASQLRAEAQQYRDILDVGHPDRYQGLPFKLKKGLEFIASEQPDFDWVVKLDDDMVARIDTLHSLVNVHNPALPLVMGKLDHKRTVLREGEWFERLYAYKEYPMFPLGSFGYVLSKPVAEYVASIPDATYYQGEDASLGIWLDESPLRDMVKWVPAKYVDNTGHCGKRTPWVVAGHKIPPQQMRECFQQMDEWPREWVENALSQASHF